MCEENQKEPGQKVDQDCVQAPKITVCQELGAAWESGWETRRPMTAGGGSQRPSGHKEPRRAFADS